MTRAISPPTSVGGRPVEVAVSALESFDLREYVEAVRRVGRAALPQDMRADAASLYRRVREARATSGVASDVASMLAFADAVLQPQWAMQIPGGKRYQTYINGPVLTWLLTSGQAGDIENASRRSGWTLHRKARSWAAYERATLHGSTSWNQVDVAPDRLQRRLRVLDRLVAVGNRCGWADPDPAVPDTVPPWTWPEYAADSTGAHALEFLTTLPQTTQHDEVGFISCIQIGECAFAAIRARVAAAIVAVQRGDPPQAADHLDRAKPFADAFDLGFAALAMMAPEHFRRFVAATGQASAVQSRRYQELQLLVYGPDPAKSDALTLFPELDGVTGGVGVCLDQLLGDLAGDHRFADVLTSARALDGSLYRWRARHLGASHRLYPFTGLELGSGYLESHYARRLGIPGPRGEGAGHR